MALRQFLDWPSIFARPFALRTVYFNPSRPSTFDLTPKFEPVFALSRSFKARLGLVRGSMILKKASRRSLKSILIVHQEHCCILIDNLSLAFFRWNKGQMKEDENFNEWVVNQSVASWGTAGKIINYQARIEMISVQKKT